MQEALALVLAYLIGSVPVTWLIFYWRTGTDLRTVGDGNVGSANAIREGVGWVTGRAALLLDVGKGLLAVSIARWLELDHVWWMLVGYLVMVGHMFPLWLRFRGGRAAATAMGAAGAFLPWQFGITMAAGTVAFLVLRIAELGILFVAAPLPFLAVAFEASDEAIAFCFSAPILAGLKSGFDRWRRGRAAALAAVGEARESG
jgi:glycerol-3-phosphate acyltransferase PlsY